MQKVCIIIPTYNERETVVTTIEALQQEFVRIHDYQMEILVFDSCSLDGTADIVRLLQKQYGNISLLTEEKKSGLGSAYKQAMQYCCARGDIDIVFEFDADGSHQPHYISEILAHFQQGADVVLGSRYVPGGSIPLDWAWHRKLLSVLGNALARIILSPKLHDYTSGFRATRVSVLRQINVNKLLSDRYAYKIHLLWELYLLPAKIMEHPIIFIDRKKGHSKFPKNNMIESLWLLIRLRLHLLKRYLKVCMAGAIGMVVQMTVFNILRHWWHPIYANAVSVELAIINNFMLNNFFSFSDMRLKKQHTWHRWLKKFSLFNLFSLGSLFLQTFLVSLGVTLFGHGVLRENMYVLTGIAAASIYNFKMYKIFIWKENLPKPNQI